MNKPDFPLTIDNTMRSAFVSCPQLYYRTYFQNWKPRQESVDLVAGKAYAAGIEAVRREFHEKKNADTDDCLAAGAQALIAAYGDFEPPAGHPKTLDRMLGALDEYFRNYGFATDYIQPYFNEHKPAIEFSFALPIPGTTHPSTGSPLIYTGRFDMLGLYNNAIFIVDEKTTRQLGQSWVKSWAMASQVTGYCWAAREYNYPVAGAIIRGISILKTKYGHAESIQYRPQWVIDRWLVQLKKDTDRMIEAWEKNDWDYNLNTSCNNYGGCKLIDVCSSQNPVRVLKNDFVKRVWNPLAHEEHDEICQCVDEEGFTLAECGECPR